MRTWPIRWKLFALSLATVLVFAIAMRTLFQSSRHYDERVQAAVAAAIHPPGAANAGDAEILRAAERAAAQALGQTRRAYLDDRIVLDACLCAAIVGLLGAAWVEALAVARRLGTVGDVATRRLDRSSEAVADDSWATATRKARDSGRFRRSTDFLEFAQAAGGFGVFELDLVTGRVTGSSLFFASAGIQNAAALFTRDEWFATIHPEDLEGLIQQFNGAITEGGRFDTSYRTVRPDGEVRWLTARGQALKDAEGYPAHLIGTIGDITDRVQSETSLRQAAESLNLAQAVAGVATLDFDLEAQRYFASQNFHEILGIASATRLDDLEGHLAAVHPEDRDRRRQAPRETTAANPVYHREYRVMLPDGSERWVAETARCTHGGDGKLVHITGSLVDVTHLKQTEPGVLRHQRRA